MNLKLAHTLAKMQTRLFLMRNVLQYSMPRTGSTLIRRILYGVFPELEQPSQHPPLVSDGLGDLIISCRHPLDVLVSIIRINGADTKRISDDTLDHYLPQLESQYRVYFNDLLNFKGYKLKLKYEKFWNNYDYIFDELERFFNNRLTFAIPVKISKEKRSNIKKICGIKNTKKIQDTLDCFDNVDEKTKIHGSHIATPEPYNYKKILTDTQIKFLKHRLQNAIQEWKEL